MNTENILKVKAWLDAGAPHRRFDMNTFYNEDWGGDNWCGTSCCIAGYIYSTLTPFKDRANAIKFIELTPQDHDSTGKHPQVWRTPTGYHSRLLNAQAMHIARRVMETATRTGWSLRRLRERVLRAGARLMISGRRMTLALSSAAAPFWAVLWPRLTALHWADP